MRNVIHTPKTVAIMDSHPLTLSGLSTLIKSIDPKGDIRIKESSLAKIAEALMYQSVDILVTDLQSVEENQQEGLDILLCLSSLYANLKIVVYTFCQDTKILWTLFNHHNVSIIARGESMADINGHFQTAFMQKRVISQKISHSLTQRNEENHNGLFRLTRSEIEILKYLFNGMDLQEIARMKQLSIKTISTHKRNAMHKLNITTDAELFLLRSHIL